MADAVDESSSSDETQDGAVGRDWMGIVIEDVEDLLKEQTVRSFQICHSSAFGLPYSGKTSPLEFAAMRHPGHVLTARGLLG